MTPQSPSLPRNHQIPPASVSETKLIGEASSSDAVPGPTSVGLRLDDDWPTLSVLSRRYIDRALEHTRGNKTRAASLLGIDRRTLNRILARERARQTAHAAAAQ
jgi:Fis family transcriptional regulator